MTTITTSSKVCFPIWETECHSPLRFSLRDCLLKEVKSWRVPSFQMRSITIRKATEQETSCNFVEQKTLTLESPLRPIYQATLHSSWSQLKFSSLPIQLPWTSQLLPPTFKQRTNSSVALPKLPPQTLFPNLQGTKPSFTFPALLEASML